MVEITDTCILCHSSKARVLTTKLRHNKSGKVVRCEECDFVRLSNPPSSSQLNEYYQSQYATEYYHDVKSDLDSLFHSFLPVQSQRIEKIKPYIQSAHKVLEIGSGTGYFLCSIKPYVGEVQGQELNKAEANYAFKEHHIATDTAAIESSGLPQQYYDHICLFQVLEHVVDPSLFLLEIKKFLKPGGKVHIEVPNLLDPLVWFYEIEEYRDFYYQAPHLTYFSPVTLERVCKMAKYEINSITAFQQTGLLNNLNWLFLKKPQASRWECLQVSPSDKNLSKEISEHVKKSFYDMFLKFNQQYQTFMETHGFGDMIFATISNY
ncbi:MAG: putative Methyltransferase [uncultured bacterium]|nr:MAG: putative Methyltransferase [uncultured bacterium]